MPSNAIAHVPVDAIVPSHQIANTIVRMVNGEWDGDSVEDDPPPEDLDGEPTVSTCPECGGVLSEHREAGLTQWRRKVGHRYSPESLADAQAEGVEATIWAAVRALEDRHQLLERMAQQSESRGYFGSARALRQRAEQARAQADAVREALAHAMGATLRPLADEMAEERERAQD